MRDLNELKITFDEGHPEKKIADSTLNQFEQDFNVVLTEDYREFLKFSNGGFPALTKLPFANGVSESSIDGFFSLTGDKEYREGVEFNSIWLRRRLEKGCVAIAQNGGGDIIYIDSDAHSSPIHMFFHSTGATPQVADSFGAFIDLIEEETDLI